MTVYAIYNQAGDLVSVGRSEPEELAAGLTVNQYPDFDPGGYRWDKLARTFVPYELPTVRTPEQQIAEAKAVLADGAAELEQLPAPTTPADLTTTVADILARAAAALNGGV